MPTTGPPGASPVSDGTAAGTARLADINPGPAPSEAGKFALRRDGTVFFGADDGQAGYEPWVLDPGSRTPRLLADLLNVGFGSFPRSITFVDDGRDRTAGGRSPCRCPATRCSSTYRSRTRTLFVSVAPFDLQASASVLLALGN